LKPLRFVRGERRNPAAARRAGSFGQRVGHGVLLPESHLVGGMPKVRFHPSITPNTMSNDPMIAATSANNALGRRSMTCKGASKGARILHL
jgi:hypothetical protein